MSFLPILSAALFVSLLPNVMGITLQENVDTDVVPVAVLSSVPAKIH